MDMLRGCARGSPRQTEEVGSKLLQDFFSRSSAGDEQRYDGEFLRLHVPLLFVTIIHQSHNNFKCSVSLLTHHHNVYQP